MKKHVVPEGVEPMPLSAYLRRAFPRIPAALLKETDVLVDGPFMLALRSFSAPWRGSTNQRLIDVKKSLAAGAAVEMED